MTVEHELRGDACWLKPKLVAQVAFADWTDANHLRHARFVGLRDDKDARDGSGTRRLTP